MPLLESRPELFLGASVMAICSSFVAFQVAPRLRASDRAVALGWWLGGALSIGSGFWATQALGLRWAQLPGPSGEAIGAAMVAWLITVLALALGLGLARRVGLAPRAAMAAGIVMALLSTWFVSVTAPEFQVRASDDKFPLLASVLALVALGLTWLMTTLETRLHGTMQGLSTSLRQAHNELEKASSRDALTQLPNRQQFEERLASAVTRADRDNRRLALLYIDIDGFKPINDSFGHGSGDVVLRAIGERLHMLARQTDAMARVGGDEFLMLLEGSPDEGSAALVAARVLKTLSEPYSLGEREVSISCSIGIVFYPDGAGQSKLIAHADAAMAAAKRAGGSTYCFFEARMDADAREQVDLLRDLRRALEQKELELYYQPKIDAKSGQPTAVEALLRWHHPVRGLITPGHFIPVAERFGLIGALGNWVIEEACRQAGAWREQGLNIRVAINLSVHQLRQDDLVERLQTALRRNGIEPETLTCEITESVAMEDGRSTQAAFHRIARAGIRLSIDDFGTGYSSLSYLRQLPAEELKIDRSFIMDLESGADARSIVDAVVKLAHALSLKVVAEGVDTARQCEILLALGCDELQGFLFARPMSAKHLLEWVRNPPALGGEVAMAPSGADTPPP